MNYRLNQDNYQEFTRFGVNKLPPRSYFIPYPDRAGADAVGAKEKRYGSSKVLCLNGDWDFAFYARPSEVPEELDTDRDIHGKIDVPSCWQFRGIDRPFYLNTRYQFPYDPPKIPTVEPVGEYRQLCFGEAGVEYEYLRADEEYNYVGIYRRRLELNACAARSIISFLGVASCIDLYVNGQFVGYSEGSHNTAEFDLTDCLHEGENELVAVVHRWCSGSYLECQDMFRNNGIFRDVLLYQMNAADFWDIDFQTERLAAGRGETDRAMYRCQAKAKIDGEGSVRITLEGPGVSISRTVEAVNGVAETVFEELQVQEWNAESPVLYQLYFEMDGSCIKCAAGFREVQIIGTDFLYNGRKIKLHGVNHHDTSCTDGYTLRPDEIERDVLLCKEYNVDTVRTSHYPPDPLFLELCDLYGIYVVDETDIETHGAERQMNPPILGRITDDPAWEAHYIDRVQRIYGRDKLHPCVTMWSLGNEAGGYYCTDRMYEWLKTVTKLPVHYESVIHTDRRAYDVGSEMYPTLAMVQAVGEQEREYPQLNDRPYFMCEYAHAMGVGPGGMEEYWDLIYRYDNLIGGCIWEMVDHAVLHEDGVYTYGGDHGEWIHDGNFCVDGLFYPDRTPSTGARIMKYVYRPIRVSYVGEETLELFYTRTFADGTRYLLKGYVNGEECFRIQTELMPLASTVVHVDNLILQKGDRLDIVTIDTWKENREVSREQIAMEPVLAEVSEERTALPEYFCVSESGEVTYGTGTDTLRISAPYTILFRARTDNDTDFSGNSLMDAFCDETEEVLSVSREDNMVCVETRICCRDSVFVCRDSYEGTEAGILVTSRLHCESGSGRLPRFGKAFALDKAFSRVQYLGRCGESYADMKAQAPIEEVFCEVKDMTEPNIRPQESGNRCDCQYAAVTDGQTEYRFTAVDRVFELGIKPYSDRELLGMRHRVDETVSGTYVTISAFQMGIGSGSCGPFTEPQYCYDMETDYELRFLINRIDR